MRYEDRIPGLISVLMPVYNVRAYIKEAVDSILKQSYSNLELIIVDDCSTDGTYEILQEISRGDLRIRLFRNQKNSKICKSLNYALAHSRGELIGRMDGDDVSEPERFHKLKAYLDQHPDIALVGSDLVGINEEGTVFNMKIYPHTAKSIEMGNKCISSVSHFWLARYEIYEKLNGYREVPYVEDYDFLLRGELQGFRYANVNEALYRIRLRSGNTVSTNGLRQRKAVEYVQALHKTEKKVGKDCFCREDYLRATDVTTEENARYIRKSEKLTRAVKSKKRPIKMIIYTLSAMMGNYYIAKYVWSTVWFRLVCILDKKMKPD